MSTTPTCKICKTNPPVIKKSICSDCVKAQKEEMYVFVDGWKASRGCFFCGEDSPIFLELDHINPSEKYRDVSRLISGGSSWKTLKVELSKCRVLCNKCHMVVTIKQQREITPRLESEIKAYEKRIGKVVK